MQFAAAYSRENEILMTKFINAVETKRGQLQMIKPDPKFKKIFDQKKSDKATIFNNNDKNECQERQLPYWNGLDQRKMDLLNQWQKPRNLLEEQIEWTKQGKMWPYPIDNEYLIGEEENVNKFKLNLNYFF